MKPVKNSDALTMARELIKAGWCKGWYARDIHGFKENLQSEKAAAFCAMGACTVAEAKWPHEATTGLVIWSFNDAPSTTKKDILALFTRAIRAEREAGR